MKQRNSDARQQDAKAGRRSWIAGLAPLWYDLLPDLVPLEAERRRVWRRRGPLALIWALGVVGGVVVLLAWLPDTVPMPAILVVLFALPLALRLGAGWLMQDLWPLECQAGRRLFGALAKHNGMTVSETGSDFPLRRFERLELLPATGLLGQVVRGEVDGVPLLAAAFGPPDRLLLVLPRPPVAPALREPLKLHPARGFFRRVLRLFNGWRQPDPVRDVTLTYWLMAPARGSASALLPPPLAATLLAIARAGGRTPRIALDTDGLLIALPVVRTVFSGAEATRRFDRPDALSRALDDLDLLFDLVRAAQPSAARSSPPTAARALPLETPP